MLNEKKWYILKSAGGYENRVHKLLCERLTINKLEHLVEEIFIPSETVTFKRQGKESQKTITYFPGYIIIKMDLTDELWHLIKQVPKISGFVGGLQKDPIPISEKELQAIKDKIESGMKQSELDSTFSIGQNVGITEGPFAEFNGTVQSVNYDLSKLTVVVSIFGRTTPIELDFDKVRLNET